MHHMKYVLIKIGRYRLKRYNVEEEEHNHYHIYGYDLPVNKEDILMLIPGYLGYYSEARHYRNLKKSMKLQNNKYIGSDFDAFLKLEGIFKEVEEVANKRVKEYIDGTNDDLITNSNIKFKLPIIIEKDGSGYYASCPALKGVHVGGDTENSAIKNAEEACSLYLQSMIKHGDAIPLNTEDNLDKGLHIVVEVRI